MRTTLTLDDDVAAKVRAECGRTGESFKAALNRLLREGLATRARQKPSAPFHVRARALGLRPGVQLDNVADLRDQLEGPGTP
jgi:hypothetical protein